MDAAVCWLNFVYRLDVVAHTCGPSYSGGRCRRIIVLIPTWTQHEMLSGKQTRRKRAEVWCKIEHLPSKWETLSSIPSTTKKKSLFTRADKGPHLTHRHSWVITGQCLVIPGSQWPSVVNSAAFPYLWTVLVRYFVKTWLSLDLSDVLWLAWGYASFEIYHKKMTCPCILSGSANVIESCCGIDLDHLLEVVSSGFFSMVKLLFFPLEISKYLGREMFHNCVKPASPSPPPASSAFCGPHLKQSFLPCLVTFCFPHSLYF
jgi:hypothetical protein